MPVAADDALFALFALFAIVFHIAVDPVYVFVPAQHQRSPYPRPSALRRWYVPSHPPPATDFSV
jgi:hypothetical protein